MEGWTMRFKQQRSRLIFQQAVNLSMKIGFDRKEKEKTQRNRKDSERFIGYRGHGGLQIWWRNRSQRECGTVSSRASYQARGDPSFDQDRIIQYLKTVLEVVLRYAYPIVRERYYWTWNGIQTETQRWIDGFEN